MKTPIKISFLSLAIAATFTACSGNNSTHVPDSTRIDSSKSGASADSTIGKNGSPNAIDSGMDKSGSGGTDTIKQGRKRKEFNR
jgi:hypothetical protein